MTSKSLRENIENVVQLLEDGGNGYRFNDPIPYTLSRSGKLFNIIIECNCDCFEDKFNNMKISFAEYIDNKGICHKGLQLSCTSEDELIFCMLSEHLIHHILTNGSTTESIQKWCNNWKETLGNNYTEKKVYDIIGEMLCTAYLHYKGMNPRWCGPEGSRHDIQCESIDGEVKSTTLRTTGLRVKISSGKQLKRNNIPLDLFVFQFEENKENGEFTINSVRSSLIDMGYDKSDLEEMITQTGLSSTANRKKRFKLLENMYIFHVDESFPAIIDSSFKDNKIPDKISNISYSIELSDYPHEEIKINMIGNQLIFEKILL